MTLLSTPNVFIKFLANLNKNDSFMSLSSIIKPKKKKTQMYIFRNVTLQFTLNILYAVFMVFSTFNFTLSSHFARFRENRRNEIYWRLCVCVCVEFVMNLNSFEFDHLATSVNLPMTNIFLLFCFKERQWPPIFTHKIMYILLCAIFL